MKNVRWSAGIGGVEVIELGGWTHLVGNIEANKSEAVAVIYSAHVTVLTCLLRLHIAPAPHFCLPSHFHLFTLSLSLYKFIYIGMCTVYVCVSVIVTAHSIFEERRKGNGYLIRSRANYLDRHY